MSIQRDRGGILVWLRGDCDPYRIDISHYDDLMANWAIYLSTKMDDIISVKSQWGSDVHILLSEIVSVVREPPEAYACYQEDMKQVKAEEY